MKKLAGFLAACLLVLIGSQSSATSQTAITGTPPPPPTLISPGSSSSPGPTINTLTPTFYWNAVSGADYYGLYIRDLATGILVFDSAARGIQITGTSYTLPAGVLEWGKPYRWNMNSHNSAGWGSYSDRLYFQTGQTLMVSLSANSSSGTAPLNTSLTADVSGTASGTINYTFWWNCNDPGTSVDQVMTICGRIPTPPAGKCAENENGIKCDAVWDDPKTVNHIYSYPGTYTAKVIAERGSAPPAESRVRIVVTNANTPPIAEAAVSTSPSGPYYGYDNPLEVTRGQSVTLYFFADKDVNGDGKASYDPDGWTNPENGVSSGGKCEWNRDLNQGTPTFEEVIGSPSSPATCNIGPYSYTFNDAPGVYEYQILRITDRTGAQSNVSRIRIRVSQSQVVSARIDSYSPSTKIEVDPGQTFTLSFTFTNTGNTAWDFWGGYSIWDANGNQVDSRWSASSQRVQPNQQGSFQWQTSLSTPGEYWLQFGVWQDRGSNLLDKKPSPSQNLIRVKPALGTIQVDATLNGATWSGSVSYRLTGPQTIDGTTVPATFSNRPTGSYTLNYQSGGPSGATLTSITPSATQTLSAGGTITFILNFSSTPPQNPILEVTPNSLNFGDVTVGQCSANQSFTVRNSGGGTLNGTASTSAPFSIVSGGSFSLGAGERASVAVKFCPTANGQANGTVSFSSNGGNVTRNVSGNGVISPNMFTLTVIKSGNGSGTVTSDPAGIDCGRTCQASFNSGTSVTLTPRAALNSTFAGWSGDPDCTDGSVTMNANKTCTATFNLNILQELIVGQIKIRADRIVPTGNGIYEAEGNITLNNIFETSARLLIDTNKLRVEGEGSFKLSEVAFIGDLTVFEGKFVLSADPPEFLIPSAIPAKFAIGQLQVEVNKLRIVADGLGGSFSLIIPNLIMPDGTSKIRVDDLMITRSRGIELNQGVVELRNVQILGGFVLRELRLQYIREENRWNAQGKLEIPLPQGCKVSLQCLLLDASLGVQGGILDQLGVGVDRLNYPIMPAVFLQKVYMEADGMAPGPPPVKLTGVLAFTGGPQIGDKYVIRVEGTGSIDETTKIELGAVVFVLSEEGRMASAKVILDPASGLSIEGELNIKDILTVRGNLQLDLNNNFKGQLQGSAKTPEDWPLIGNREVNLVTAYVDNTLLAAQILIFSVVYTPRSDINCWWDKGNWHIGCNLRELQVRTFSSQIIPLGVIRQEFIVVPSGLPFVVFRATYEGAPVDLYLVDPNGKTITKADAEIEPDKYLYGNNPAISEVYLAVAQPQAGTWKLVLDRSAQSSAMMPSQSSGAVQIQVLGGNAAPSLKILQPAKDVSDSIVTIKWSALDSDDQNASISLFYDTDNQNADGQFIIGGLKGTKGQYRWNTTKVPNGDYYIYGVIDDGKNPPVVAYSTGRVKVRNGRTILIGDANNDGVVDIGDVADIISGKTGLDLAACDVNTALKTCDNDDASLIAQALNEEGKIKPLKSRPQSLNPLHKRKRIGEKIKLSAKDLATVNVSSFTTQGISISVTPLGAHEPGFSLEALGEGVSSIDLQVFALSGRRVFSAKTEPGVLKIIFYGRDQHGQILANGVYLYVVRVRGFDGREYVSEVRKLVILR
jgi:hypothetical protein